MQLRNTLSHAFPRARYLLKLVALVALSLSPSIESIGIQPEQRVGTPEAPTKDGHELAGEATQRASMDSPSEAKKTLRTSHPECPEFGPNVRRWDLPRSMHEAQDIRWLNSKTLLASTSNYGVVEIVLGKRPQVGDVVVPRGLDSGMLRMPWNLAMADELVVASGNYRGRRHAVAWKKPTAPPTRPFAGIDKNFAEILDVDAQGDLVAVLAPRIDSKGRLVRDGSLGWLGWVDHGSSDGLADSKPFFHSAEGASIRSFVNCNLMDRGVVRFLADGSLLVLPEVEEGAYLFDSSHKLRRTWSAKRLGFDAGCPLSPKEADRLGLDEPGRWEWLAERRIVDDVLPLPDGRAALLIRSVSDGRSRWEITILDPRGETVKCPWVLPGTEQTFAVESSLARLRVDVEGRRVALLVSMLGATEHPLRTAAPQLLILELQ